MREEVGMYTEKSRKMGKKLKGRFCWGVRLREVEWRKGILLFTSFPSPQFRLFAISMDFVIEGRGS